MSGPKDFVFVFEAIRRMEIELRIRQEQNLRAEQTHARLASRRNQILSNVKDLQKKRVSAIHKKQQRRIEVSQKQVSSFMQKENVDAKRDVLSGHKKEQLQQDLNVAIKELKNQIQQLGEFEDEPQIKSLEQEINQLESIEIAEALKKTTQYSERLQELHTKLLEARFDSYLEQVTSWKTELTTDLAVLEFQFDQAQLWQKNVDELILRYNQGDSIVKLTSIIKDLAMQAQQIYDAAGSLKSKAQIRNTLLGDMIASLKEIGFAVSNPVYQDGSNSTGPVILKAVRGREEMTATVDLNDHIKSVWNGIAQEACRDTFFDYVDKMSVRGIQIEADRSELQKRPKLLEKDAMNLPRQQQQKIGG